MIVAINLNESAEQVKTYITRHRLSFPHVLDADAKLAAWFGVRGTPMSFPAFQGVLSDADIWAVLAFIKSTWPPQARAFQESANERGR